MGKVHIPTATSPPWVMTISTWNQTARRARAPRHRGTRQPQKHYRTPLQPTAVSQDVTDDQRVSPVPRKESSSEGRDPTRNGETLGCPTSRSAHRPQDCISSRTDTRMNSVCPDKSSLLGSPLRGFSFGPKEVSDYSFTWR